MSNDKTMFYYEKLEKIAEKPASERLEAYKKFFNAEWQEWYQAVLEDAEKFVSGFIPPMDPKKAQREKNEYPFIQMELWEDNAFNVFDSLETSEDRLAWYKFFIGSEFFAHASKLQQYNFSLHGLEYLDLNDAQKAFDFFKSSPQFDYIKVFQEQFINKAQAFLPQNGGQKNSMSVDL